MAHIITIHLLVNADEHGEFAESAIYDGINDMLRTAQEPVDGENDEFPFIVDWALDEPRAAVIGLTQSIANGTYEEGDFVHDPAYPAAPLASQ
jgi:hypothetical protein